MRHSADGRLLPAMLALFVMTTVGCSKGEPRGDVLGEVIFDGKSVEAGMVIFEPILAGSSPRNVPIENGKYHVDGEGAMRPGEYRVRITAADQSRLGSDTLKGVRSQVQFVQLLPESWNVQSRLSVNVKPGKNEFRFCGTKSEKPAVETKPE